MDETARAAPAKNRFDEADRDGIRRALLRYIDENRIGAPTLQKLIAAKNDLDLDRIPLKTLQRFVGNTHRTNDALVRFCNKFVESLADTDPIAALGEQFAAFLGVWRPDHDCRPVPQELRGRYQGRAECASSTEKGIRILPASNPAVSWTPFCQIEITQPSGRPFAIVSETIANWRRWPEPERSPVDDDGEAVQRRYEGIAIYPNGCLLLILRNVLSGTPRIYWLDRFSDHPLAGHGHEAVARIDRNAALGGQVHSTVRVMFDRAED